jgi:hypothetical protein
MHKLYRKSISTSYRDGPARAKNESDEPLIRYCTDTGALLTAPAGGRRGRPTCIPRGCQAGILRAHARLVLSDEEATPPGQSASRVWLRCPDRLTRL